MAFGLAALLIVAGIAVGSYLGGWWPGANADSQTHPLPADLGVFIEANCADGQVSPTSEFADGTGGATSSNDPDPARTDRRSGRQLTELRCLLDSWAEQSIHRAVASPTIIVAPRPDGSVN